jgi:hypothetical protein
MAAPPYALYYTSIVYITILDNATVFPLPQERRSGPETLSKNQKDFDLFWSFDTAKRDVISCDWTIEFSAHCQEYR